MNRASKNSDCLLIYMYIQAYTCICFRCLIHLNSGSVSHSCTTIFNTKFCYFFVTDNPQFSAPVPFSPSRLYFFLKLCFTDTDTDTYNPVICNRSLFFSLFGFPVCFFNDQFHCFQAFFSFFIIPVPDTNQAASILICTFLPGSQAQTRFHINQIRSLDYSESDSACMS